MNVVLSYRREVNASVVSLTASIVTCEEPRPGALRRLNSVTLNRQLRRATSRASAATNAIVERCCCIDAATGSLDCVVLNIRDDRTVAFLHDIDALARVVRDVGSERVSLDGSRQRRRPGHRDVDPDALPSRGDVILQVERSSTSRRRDIDRRLSNTPSGRAGKSASSNSCVETRRSAAHVNLDAVRSVRSGVLTVDF